MPELVWMQVRKEGTGTEWAKTATVSRKEGRVLRAIATREVTALQREGSILSIVEITNTETQRETSKTRPEMASSPRTRVFLKKKGRASAETGTEKEATVSKTNESTLMTEEMIEPEMAAMTEGGSLRDEEITIEMAATAMLSGRKERGAEKKSMVVVIERTAEDILAVVGNRKKMAIEKTTDTQQKIAVETTGQQTDEAEADETSPDKETEDPGKQNNEAMLIVARSDATFARE